MHVSRFRGTVKIFFDTTHKAQGRFHINRQAGRAGRFVQKHGGNTVGKRGNMETIGGYKFRNTKLTVSIVLLLMLCMVLLGKRGGWEVPEGTPTPTPTVELPMELSNVWVVGTEGTFITVLCQGENVVFRLPQALPEELSGCIADLTVEQGVVTKAKIKNDTIEAKVLRIGADFIELEGYGVVPLTENSRVYRMSDEVTEEQWVDVVVGYTTSSFVLDGDKICAALIEKEVAVSSIRVVLQTASYGGYFHETVECGSDVRFYVSDGSEKTTWYQAGEQVIVTPELVAAHGGRIYLGTEKDAGKISLYNVRRAIGTPSYRGTLEITLQGGRLLVVNELSLEEYLYGVLPSEMPDSFGEEALRAQAVCARSYACNQLLANRYCAYGAHVDDSMNCQVYQNYGETEEAVRAVKATFGKVLTQNGKSITAYYFSCSYGHTSNSADVWGSNTGSLLSGVAQTEGKVTQKLSTEDGFEHYLNSERDWYDAESMWFRWETVIGSELDALILERLKTRQQAAEDCILIKTEETKIQSKKSQETGKTEMTFVKGIPEKFGTLEDIIVAERSESGLITKLLLVGSEATYLILKEYNIRAVLAPVNTVYLKNGSTTSNMTLLPSAYFTVDAKNNLFVISGGGYGHGVGMSQYGAKYLAEHGKSFEEILTHFYQGADLGYLY